MLSESTLETVDSLKCRVLPAPHGALSAMSLGRGVGTSHVLAMLVTVALVVFSCASATNADTTLETRSLGLTSMGAAACAETSTFCEQTVLPALAEDPKLTAFLADARAAAKKQGDGGKYTDVADAYRAIVATATLRFPELLALGCCLAAGECLEDVLAAAGDVGDISSTGHDAARDASNEAAAEALMLAADSNSAATKMPAAALLGANAFACRPPGDLTRCGTTLVELYRSAGTAGFEIGAMRAGEALLARFAGEFIDEQSELSCPQVGDDENQKYNKPAGDGADAATARALFKGLLVGYFDKRAAVRLKELAAVEGRWLTSQDVSGGKGDVAYLLADVLVDGAARFIFVLFIFGIAFRFRNSRIGLWTRSVLWRYSGCSKIARTVRIVQEAFGVVPHRRVNGGRAAARLDKRQSAKKLSKQIAKQLLEDEKKRE